MPYRFDFLVLGSGIAGLTFALRVAQYGTVAVVTKKERAESNTNYAQGGIAAVFSGDDSPELHIEDTLRTGLGLCRPEAVRAMVEEGPARVRELAELGVRFTGKKNSFDLGREGGHSRDRIVHAADLTGREIERGLLAAISDEPNIRTFENHVALELVTEHHLSKKRSEDDRDYNIHCWGAYVLDAVKGNVALFLADVVMLSTGGVGQAYLHTTNPAIATGDGVAMGYRAGARIANMEFIQFHPTSLFNSGSPSFLISEAVRGFGAVLRLQNGEEFMGKYDSRGSLAPRDIVAYAIDTELKKRGEEYVVLDLTHLDAHAVRERFPHIYEHCRDTFKIDITSEPVPVVPAAHYCCGGVETDLHGRTSIRGLFAAGEVSMTGVHGANRLASNSLLEALVFSARAAEASRDLLSAKQTIPEIEPWDDSGTLNSEEWVLIAHNRREIQQVMWDYVGILRSDLRLRRAERRIRLIRDEVESFFRKTTVTEPLIELRNLALCAELIIRCSLRRRESRGLFITTDYPEQDSAGSAHDTILD